MDNRIRLPGPKIDFAADVGLTGQDHDDYPAPGQARYDLLRMYLIGLLAQQSSVQPPTQCRDGTPWLDTSGDPPQLKISLGGQWVPYARVLRLGSGAAAVTLADWFDRSEPLLQALAQDLLFAGHATSSTNSIAVPEQLRSRLTPDSRALVYVNGLLLDPRVTVLDQGIVQLGQSQLRAEDRFTVLIRDVPDQNFYVPDVRVP